MAIEALDKFHILRIWQLVGIPRLDRRIATIRIVDFLERWEMEKRQRFGKINGWRVMLFVFVLIDSLS
jgi:hypothetical protein